MPDRPTGYPSRDAGFVAGDLVLRHEDARLPGVGGADDLLDAAEVAAVGTPPESVAVTETWTSPVGSPEPAVGSATAVISQPSW